LKRIYVKIERDESIDKEFEMTPGAAAGGAGAGAAAAMAQAIKASGAIVRVESMDFQTILSKVDNPLVVYSESTFISTKYHYLTAYKGLIFYTKTATPLTLRPSAEVIRAQKIWIPS
jgi:hypothetical protein